MTTMNGTSSGATPSLDEQGYLYDVSIFPDINWTKYTMRILHLPTGIFVQGEGNLSVEGMCPFYERLSKKLAMLVKWRRRVRRVQGLVKCPR